MLLVYFAAATKDPSERPPLTATVERTGRIKLSADPGRMSVAAVRLDPMLGR